MLCKHKCQSDKNAIWWYPRWYSHHQSSTKPKNVKIFSTFTGRKKIMEPFFIYEIVNCETRNDIKPSGDTRMCTFHFWFIPGSAAWKLREHLLNSCDHLVHSLVKPAKGWGTRVSPRGGDQEALLRFGFASPRLVWKPNDLSSRSSTIPIIW